MKNSNSIVGSYLTIAKLALLCLLAASNVTMRAQSPAKQGKTARRDSSTERLTGEYIYDHYLKALGGEAALAKLTTRVIKGALTDQSGQTYPLEVIQKAPDEYRMAITLPRGTEYRGFDGRVAWGSLGKSRWKIEGMERDGMRHDAEMFPAANLKERYSMLFLTGEVKIDDHEVYLIEARGRGNIKEKLYFDASNNLLIRRIVLTKTIYGIYTEETDFGDYRAVHGIKLPFRVQRKEIDAQWTETYKSIQLNVPVDDETFSKPAPTR